MSDTPPTLDLSSVDRALNESRIALPAGVTPGGSLKTITVLPTRSHQEPVFATSPEQEKPTDGIEARLSHSDTDALTVPDTFYGAKSAA